MGFTPLEGLVMGTRTEIWILHPSLFDGEREPFDEGNGSDFK